MTHLGHNMDVHMAHYRQTSDLLERVQVAKLLLIQDMGVVGKFVGKKLEEIQLEGKFLYMYSATAVFNSQVFLIARLQQCNDMTSL